MASKFPSMGRGARPLECRECGLLRKEGAQISARGLCPDCAERRMRLGAEQLIAKEGDYWDEWCRSMVALAGRLGTP